MTTTQPKHQTITLDELTLGMSPVVLGGPSPRRSAKRRPLQARLAESEASAPWSSARDSFSNPR